MTTLWDLIQPLKEFISPLKPRPPAKPALRAKPISTKPAPANSMQARYERMAKQMLTEHGIRVRKWRTSMSGVAWQVAYHDGSTSRLIESPRPKGPVSASIFLHEVGHHVIGFGRYKPRCLEEYHAWMYALEQMEKHELNITEPVTRRVHESLYYAIYKARRRGLKQLPVELEPYAICPDWLDSRGRRKRQTAEAAH